MVVVVIWPAYCLRLHEAATWWVSFGAGFILAPFFSAQVLVDGFELFDGHFA